MYFNVYIYISEIKILVIIVILPILFIVLLVYYQNVTHNVHYHSI